MFRTKTCFFYFVDQMKCFLLKGFLETKAKFFFTFYFCFFFLNCDEIMKFGAGNLNFGAHNI